MVIRASVFVIFYSPSATCDDMFIARPFALPLIPHPPRPDNSVETRPA
jgi:hypothetical protein